MHKSVTVQSKTQEHDFCVIRLFRKASKLTGRKFRKSC